MKKKLLFMAALAGAVTLGSCVKDDESASVTAVRNAKAAELNANAANLQAQALYNAARAASEQANAAYTQARTKYEEAQARQEAAQADQDEIAAAQAAATAQANLEAAKAQAETALVNAQQQLLEAQQQQAANALSSLYNAYTNVQGQILNKQAQLLGAKHDLAVAKLNSQYVDKAVANTIANDKKQLAIEQARLEVFKNTEYKTMDDTKIQAAVAAKLEEYQLAQNALQSSDEVKALYESYQPIDDALTELNDQINLINDLNNLYWEWVDTDGDGIGDTWQAASIVDYIGGWQNGVNYREYNAAGNQIGWYAAGGWDKNARFNEYNKLKADRDKDSWTEWPSEQLGKSTDKAGTTNKYNNVTAYAQLAAANNQLTAAKAMAETTDAEKAAKKAAVEAAEDAVAQANDNIASWKDQLAQQEENQAKYEEKIAEFDVTAYAKALETVVAAVEAQEKAEDAMDEARAEVDKLWAEWNALNTYATIDVEAAIALCEANIENHQKNLAEAEANLSAIQTTWVGGNQTDLTSAIAYFEARIKLLEDEIEALEAQAATYLAQMKKAAEEPAAEEPAADEGGEG